MTPTVSVNNPENDPKTDRPDSLQVNAEKPHQRGQEKWRCCQEPNGPTGLSPGRRDTADVERREKQTPTSGTPGSGDLHWEVPVTFCL